jgi:hypothetical protein
MDFIDPYCREFIFYHFKYHDFSLWSKFFQKQMIFRSNFRDLAGSVKPSSSTTPSEAVWWVNCSCIGKWKCSVFHRGHYYQLDSAITWLTSNKRANSEVNFMNVLATFCELNTEMALESKNRPNLNSDLYCHVMSFWLYRFGKKNIFFCWIDSHVS